MLLKLSVKKFSISDKKGISTFVTKGEEKTFMSLSLRVLERTAINELI
jgi:hypothetical protein